MRNISLEIDEKLKEIESQEGVRILHAVESGSRAWGFASPDSDYDVRFVYVRPIEAYLRLDEPKDVIEWQLDEVLDINGWDLKKALKQFARGNATLFEWSGSPIVYKTTEEWAEIREISRAYFSEKSAVCHYYGIAKNTWHDYLCRPQISYKKYFYALRPLLAAIYIECFHETPPVQFADLMKMEMSEELRASVERLLEEKKIVGEKELKPQIPVIHSFIEKEMERQKQIVDSLPDDHNRSWEELNVCFMKIAGNCCRVSENMTTDDI